MLTDNLCSLRECRIYKCEFCSNAFAGSGQLTWACAWRDMLIVCICAGAGLRIWRRLIDRSRYGQGHSFKSDLPYLGAQPHPLPLTVRRLDIELSALIVMPRVFQAIRPQSHLSSGSSESVLRSASGSCNLTVCMC